jgi:GTPase SAR1 family protein
MAEPAPMVFRLCVIGDFDVGKTSLIVRYIENHYEEQDLNKPQNFDAKMVCCCS